MTGLEYQFYYRRNLPHYQPPDATLFVTFRLVNSIPSARLRKLREDTKRIMAALDKIPDENAREAQAYREQLKWFARWDNAMHTNAAGPHWLAVPEVAKILQSSLHFLDAKLYSLDAFCLMSNHAHVVLKPLESTDGSFYSLARIMHSLKRFSARSANQWLNRSGQFWDHERYDHVVAMTANGNALWNTFSTVR